MIDLNEYRIESSNGSTCASFPRLMEWLGSDVTADPEAFRGIRVSEVVAALAYARSLVAVAFAIVAERDDERGDSFADVESVSICLDGAASAARRELSDALAQAAEYLAAHVDAEHGERDAADVLAGRQAWLRRVLAIGPRIAALARGDAALARDVRAQVPDEFRDIDGAEAALAHFEADIRAQVVARAAHAAVAHAASSTQQITATEGTRS